MQVIVDDLLVSYERIGSGEKTILFLHGWADPSETFNKLIAELGNAYSIVTIDLAGFGHSQHPHKPWDVPDYSNYVAKFIKKLNIEPYAVIGHSNGGAIAMNSVASRLIKPMRLILLASSGIRTTDTFRKKTYMMLAKPAKLVLLPLPKHVQVKLKKSLYQKMGSDLYVAEHMADTFKKIVNYDVQSEAKNISIPTLLIYGNQDWITPVEHAKILSGLIKKSKLKIIQNAGHFLHQNKAAEVAEEINKFLK